MTTAGYHQLSWTSDKTEANSNDYELQQATSLNFNDARLIYQGPDLSSTISGLANGVYYYRIRQQPQQQWSKIIQVEVKHHSLTRAFGFFGLGAFMFIVTTLVLLKGARGQQ